MGAPYDIDDTIRLGVPYDIDATVPEHWSESIIYIMYVYNLLQSD
jgi:hypothetical protein